MAAFVLLLVAAVVGCLLVRCVAAKQRERELLAIAAAGKPVLPAEIAMPADPRPDPGPWLARVASLQQAWTPADLAEPGAYAALRARAALAPGTAQALEPDAQAAFAALEACASAADAPIAVARVLAVLESRDGIVDPPPCGREAVRLLALGREDEIALARQAAGLRAIDPAAITRALESSGAHVPTLPAIQLVRLSEALRVEALRAIWNEREADALAVLAAQGEAARIVQGSPLLVGHMIWCVLVEERLATLELLVPRLARGTDLAALEAELTALRPRALAIAGLEGERAYGNRLFQDLRAGRASASVPAVPEPPLGGLLLSYDHAAYLREFRARIERLTKIAAQRGPIERPGWLQQRVAHFANLLGPGGDNAEKASDRVEARLALARAALIAFRGGAQEVLKWLPGSVDPYDGKPLRCALSQDGLVVLWSVGEDRVDDAGDERRDIVWRLKLR